MASSFATPFAIHAFSVVGAADAQHLGAVNDTVAALLAPLSGKIEQKAVDLWAEYRAAFIAGFSEVACLPQETIWRRWSRLIEALGFEKPRSPSAVAKAAQRAKAPSKAVVTTVAAPAAPTAQPVNFTPTDQPAKWSATPQSAAASVKAAASARESACIELLHSLSAEALIKAQAFLLTLAERQA